VVCIAVEEGDHVNAGEAPKVLGEHPEVGVPRDHVRVKCILFVDTIGLCALSLAQYGKGKRSGKGRKRHHDSACALRAVANAFSNILESHTFHSPSNRW
jgi:hypothetical protein